MTASGLVWDAQRYGRDAAFVPVLGLPVVDLLAPRPGERILDLGCGDGSLTEALAAAGCRVTGVDASAEMISAAEIRGRQAGFAVRRVDGHALDYDGAFDAVFSNAALHWMLDPDRVIAGVWRALRPGGRFVGEMGGEGNVALITAAVGAALRRRGQDGAMPFYFPSVADYTARLEAGGFTVTAMTLFARPTPLPMGMAAWLATLAAPALAGFEAGERAAILAEAEAALRPVLYGEGGWHADYVRLRFAATR
jgi:SAM-dependent methyltransferase